MGYFLCTAATLLGLFPLVCSALASINPSIDASVAAVKAGSRSRRRPEEPIPITVLSGFLGAGKTNVLSHVLNNNQGLRIAVIVNDMASVNIDSKIVNRMTNAPAGMVELQNGCACCSKSEELLSSVADLVTLNDMRAEDESFDHIVVELSGIADPASIRSQFQEYAFYNMPLLERVRLDTMVTVIDCSTFTDYLQSAQTANFDEAPELFRPEEKELAPLAEYDGISTNLLATLGLLPGDRETNDAESGVAELIVSQTETADVVILNKVDLLDAENADTDTTLNEIRNIVQAMNPRARVYPATFGAIPLDDVIGVARGLGVVQAGIIDDHKDAVQAVSTGTGRSTAVDASCATPTCTDPTHDHNHHGHDHNNPVGSKDQTDHSHSDASTATASHSHSHSHDRTIPAATPCADLTCSDTSHSHSHEHVVPSVDVTSSCSDPDCTDPSHSHAHDDSTSTIHANIGSFVYRARRPFHPDRLVAFLNRLRIKRGLPNVDPTESVAMDRRVFKVLRSKGFAWCANSDVSALYWSHAGISFDLSCLGSWWATLPREQWPPDAVDTILQDFDLVTHEEKDSSFVSVGDRRQEIVFIGPMLGDKAKQDEISTSLNQCLLNDDEWDKYISKRSTEGALAKTYPSRIETQPVTY